MSYGKVIKQNIPRGHLIPPPHADQGLKVCEQIEKEEKTIRYIPYVLKISSDASDKEDSNKKD